MRFGSLFAGIGGLDLGLERAGMECIWQVENDDYCNRVLEEHWPDVPRYGDVHDVGRHNLETPDLICGGFPCQPVSLAGKRKAQADPRWLWPEFARVVDELRPRYVLVENVPGLYTLGGAEVLADLASLGYDAEWDAIPAAAVGAPHLRYRVFIVAVDYSVGRRLSESNKNTSKQEAQQRIFETTSTGVADANAGGRNRRTRIFGEGRRKELANSGQWTTEPDVGRVAHGVPARVDRLRALGNAIVPQVAEWIMRQIVNNEIA